MEAPITQADLVRGGENVKIRIAPDYEVKTVMVRQIKAKEVDAYLEAESMGEEELLAFVTGLPKEAIEELYVDDLDKLTEANDRQNFTFARKRESRALERTAHQIKALEKINPKLYQEQMDKVRTAMDSAVSSVTPSQQPRFPGARRPRE